MMQRDGSRRAWHGICTESSWLSADGGVARYRLRLEPALALLALRLDSYIFHDKNARDIVTELLADYPQVRFEFDAIPRARMPSPCSGYATKRVTTCAPVSPAPRKPGSKTGPIGICDFDDLSNATAA
jgi:uncharacterized protein involved in type VI secretion and phage assembly